ncbi:MULTISPECIES: glycosyltransferase family 2 protein [Bacteroides]|uniref:glycosyltransferase family 2 protein n=1 Tax=Bacteroides TaxID=816 RepID=UPI001D5D8F8C|nr:MULTISPECIES: glycosyltransferase family 2 protein [Bacteroides]HJD91052.1 glycosyltransferase [Bacteroides coprosuis]
MNKPLFSIITVTFNAENTVERTLISVKQQSFRNIEYIVIDGASKDRTLSILQAYQSDIDQLISEPDSGLYDAMNKALNIARGEYICFLNAGDKFHQEHTLAQIVSQLDNLNFSPDVVYGETALVDNNGVFLRMRRLSAPKSLTWKSFKQGMLVCHQAFFAKRELVSTYDLQYKFSSDFDWCIKILKKANSTYHTQLTLIDYLHEGLTTANHKKSLMERFKIMSKHYGIISTIFYHVGFIIRSIFKK